MGPSIDIRTLRAARWAVSTFFFVDGALLGGWAPYIPVVKERLALDPRSLGFALLASAIGAVTTMPFAGALIHRFGSRKVAIIAGLALAVVMPFVVSSPSLWGLIGILYLMGASNGQMDVSMNAHSLAVQHRYDKPILSAVHGWFSVGGFAGGAGAALALKLGINPCIFSIGWSIALASLLIAVTPRMLPASEDQQEDGPKFALPKGPILILGALVFCSFISEGAVWDWLAVYLRTDLKVTTSLAAAAFGLSQFAMFAARFVGDSWIHRFGMRKVLVASAALATLGILSAVVLPIPAVAIAGALFVGVGLANLVPIIFKAAGKVPGVSPGLGLTAVTTCGYSGFLLGPPAIGFLASQTSLRIAFGSIAALCLVVMLAGRFSKAVPTGH